MRIITRAVTLRWSASWYFHQWREATASRRKEEKMSERLLPPPEYRLANLVMAHTAYKAARSRIADLLKEDRLQFLNGIEHRVEHACQQDKLPDVFNQLRYFRLAAPTRRMKTSFRPLPILQAEDGTILGTYGTTRQRWQQYHATIEAGVLMTPQQMLNKVIDG